MTKVLFTNIKQSILLDLANAEKSIKIAVAWFTHQEFYNILMKKLKSGIEVTVIIINDPINNREGGLDWQCFINAGGNLHFSNYPKIMHHKFCLIDNDIIYNGSFNWTYYADKINRENIMRFQGNEVLLQDFKNEFNKLILKHKKYKKIKKYTLEDLLKFQVDKAFNFYIAKELHANSKWLIKSKQFSLADKVLEATISTSSQSMKQKLVPIQSNINKLNKQIIRNELVGAFINKELKTVKRKIQVVKTTTPGYRKPISLNKNISSNSRTTPDLVLHTQLLKSLKKESFQGDFGELRINLKWSTYDDLDLHVIDPLKNHIFFSEKEATAEGSKGQLDVDANGGGDRRENPQENIFWEDNPPSGIYSIYVNHYTVNRDIEVPFLLSIITTTKSKIIYGKVNHENLKTMLVAKINYKRGVGITKIQEIKTRAEIK